MKPLTWILYAAFATSSGAGGGAFSAHAALATAGLQLGLHVDAGTAADDADDADDLDSRAERDGLLAADRAHAAASAGGIVGGFAGALDDDVVFLYPGRTVTHGRAAVEALLAALPGAAAQRMTWSPVRVDVSADGRRGYSYGYGERTRPDSAGRMTTTQLKYIAYWRKGADARWKVAAWALIPGGPASDSAEQPRTAPAGCETPTTEYERPAYAAGGASSAARAEASGVPSGAAAAEAILRVDAEFSARAAAEGAEAAFGTYVADDGAAVGGAATIDCGRAAVRARFAGAKAGDLTWKPAVADAAPSADLGFTVGVAASRHGEQTFYSKYLTIWRRQPDGTWRFVADGGNAAPAPEH